MNSNFEKYNFSVPPTVWTLHENVHASYGQEVTLECISEACPNTVNYWLHDRNYVQGKQLVDVRSKKFNNSNSNFFFSGGTYETVMVDNVYKVITKLIIIPMKTSNFGAYKCVAKNFIGQAEKFIYLYRE